MRVEKDMLGELAIEDNLYYGVQTARSLQNFAVSGRSIEDYFYLIKCMAFIKKAASLSNYDAGELDQEKKTAICQAADDIINARMKYQFPVDIYQAGGGISINMNINEVIANRANELITGYKGYDCIHPNEHVNMSQSTNDVLPTAMKMACTFYIDDLLKSLYLLEQSLYKKVNQFAGIVKIARTCLQDAVPITLGQQFSGYHSFIKRQIVEIQNLKKDCLNIVIGATAVGTGIGVVPGYTERMYKYLPEVSGLPVVKEENFFDGLQNADSYVKISSSLKTLSTGLSKIGNDFRLLSSGPRAGLAEINLPAVQPGSSIMPGKVNPCIPEMMMQVCFDLYGKDLTITMAADKGELDLNIWEPIILKNLFDSFKILTNAIRLFTEKCIEGLTANEKVCLKHAETSLSLAVVLSSLFGYEKANQISLEAYEKNLTIKEAVINNNLLSEKEANEYLNPSNLTNPSQMNRWKK